MGPVFWWNVEVVKTGSVGFSGFSDFIWVYDFNVCLVLPDVIVISFHSLIVMGGGGGERNS